MKQLGYRTVFHIYLIFFLSLLGTILPCLPQAVYASSRAAKPILRTSWH